MTSSLFFSMTTRSQQIVAVRTAIRAIAYLFICEPFLTSATAPITVPVTIYQRKLLKISVALRTISVPIA